MFQENVQYGNLWGGLERLSFLDDSENLQLRLEGDGSTLSVL